MMLLLMLMNGVGDGALKPNNAKPIIHLIFIYLLCILHINHLMADRELPRPLLNEPKRSTLKMILNGRTGENRSNDGPSSHHHLNFIGIKGHNDNDHNDHDDDDDRDDGSMTMDTQSQGIGKDIASDIRFIIPLHNTAAGDSGVSASSSSFDSDISSYQDGLDILLDDSNTNPKHSINNRPDKSQFSSIMMTSDEIFNIMSNNNHHHHHNNATTNDVSKLKGPNNGNNIGGAAGASSAAGTAIGAAGGGVGGVGGGVGGGGSTLDEFVTGKLGNSETGASLPYFLTEPESAYVVKNRPAVLKCKATHALQLHFKCSGSSQPPPSTHDKHVDPHTGVHLEEVTATIHRDLVDEYFGKGPFKCECHAWSSRGIVKSQAATVNIAYIRKQFITSPTSLRVELGTRAELYCEPPTGYPDPIIIWNKNNIPLTNTNSEYEPIIMATGTLTFRQVTLQDMANYTCVAENIAGKRTSDSAVLIVYVNGGWSPWSPWRDCKCPGKLSQGRKRTRTCTNPIPMNGGSECSGPQIQKSADCLTCPDETQIVSSEGFDMPPSAVKRHFDWTLYLGLAFVTAVFFAFGSALICCARRGIRVNQHYGMTRTVDPKYLTDINNKKEIRMHIETTTNDNYDYANPSQRFLPPTTNHLINGGALGCLETEHHYDVPNLSANYVNPIDDLSVDYLSDTPDTSTVDTSNSTYDVNGKLNNGHSASKSSTYDQLNCSGGSLSLYSGEIMLYIPEHSIARSMRKQVSLMLLSDETSRINIPNQDATLIVASTIVHCSPRNYVFLKPVILKIPHCLLEPSLWTVSVYHADVEYDDLNVNWHRILVIGEETINTPVFVQMEPQHLYIMTEQLGRFVIVAEPKTKVPSIPLMMQALKVYSSLKMRLLAFSQTTSSTTSYSLRIYIVREFPNSRDLCTAIESKLGGSFIGESEPFAFHLNNNSMNIRLRSIEVELWESECDLAGHEQTIPYQHILSNNSMLHCEFIIKRNEPLYAEDNLQIDFAQCCSNINSVCSSSTGTGDSSSATSINYTDHNIHTFRVRRKMASSLAIGYSSPANASLERQAMVTMDSHGNYVNETSLPLTWMHLPLETKRQICSALDLPREDEHDWRLLAKKLNTDRYIAYFATKPSPTEQILNLWECRAATQRSTSPAHAIVELLMILKDIERQDVIDLITETIGTLWI